MKIVQMELYAELLPALTAAFHRIEALLEKPQLVEIHTFHFFRYSNMGLKEAAIQKLARLVSGLHASYILLQTGFVQELGVLLRTLDEFAEDTCFLCYAIKDGNVTDLHRNYLEVFYQEEFDTSGNLFLAEQNRKTIPRRKIHAALARYHSQFLNQSDAQELHHTLSQTYSGYVHGASPHIMEMYGGEPPHYHVDGMLDTSRFEENVEQLWPYFDRGINTMIFVALVFGDNELVKDIYELRHYFELQSGRTEWESMDTLSRRLKKK
jgi:hypothetical protein